MFRKWMVLGMALILILACAAAAAESAEELLRKGIACYDGVGVERDPVKAVQFFRQAADLGNADAMDYLATCYMYGDGVEENQTEANRWFTKAAEGGNITSMFTLGSAYESSDPPAAFKWMKKAAELGDANAMYTLGYYYEEGIGTEKDEAKAEEWYRCANEAWEQ